MYINTNYSYKRMYCVYMYACKNCEKTILGQLTYCYTAALTGWCVDALLCHSCDVDVWPISVMLYYLNLCMYCCCCCCYTLLLFCLSLQIGLSHAYFMALSGDCRANRPIWCSMNCIRINMHTYIFICPHVFVCVLALSIPHCRW